MAQCERSARRALPPGDQVIRENPADVVAKLGHRNICSRSCRPPSYNRHTPELLLRYVTGPRPTSTARGVSRLVPRRPRRPRIGYSWVAPNVTAGMYIALQLGCTSTVADHPDLTASSHELRGFADIPTSRAKSPPISCARLYLKGDLPPVK